MPGLHTTLAQGPPRGNLSKGLQKLRETILQNGIPGSSDGMSDLRIYIWLVLLSAPPTPTDRYLDLVRQGPSPSYAKIRDDTFRTFSSDPLFRRRVTENSLTRVLNAVSWMLHDAHEAHVNGWMSPPSIGSRAPPSFTGSPPPSSAPMHSHPRTSNGARSPEVLRTGMVPQDSLSDAGMSSSAHGGQDTAAVGYVQGMNVLAAPFCYAARSEVQAFTAFNTFLKTQIPGYVRGGSMEGVHKGTKLVDRILEVVDFKLAQHLQERHLSAAIWAFGPVLTCCASVPPLPEVLSLWDFYMAYGAHLNLVCIVAQLVLIRDDLLKSARPNDILRQLPSLNAQAIKSMAVSFLGRIPDDLYAEIVSHAQ
ncbi:MAG: hypothetical protein Q9162_003759 [Coniocarpon cinnabarinum]